MLLIHLSPGAGVRVGGVVGDRRSEQVRGDGLGAGVDGEIAEPVYQVGQRRDLAPDPWVRRCSSFE